MRRLNVTFGEDENKVLDELSEGTTMSDVIRKALAIYKWIKERKMDGSKILVEKDGNIREIEFI